MISKIIKAKYVYNKITIDPGTIDGLTEKQINKLKKLALLSDDWKFLDILHYNLAPFFEATKLLSTKNFPTLSSAKFVQNTLMNFLENESSAKCFLLQPSPTVERENMLRASLLKFMKVYFVEKMSTKQKLQSLLACFFDPRTNECLTEKEYQEAESKLMKKFAKSALRQYPRRSTHTNICLQNEQNYSRSDMIDSSNDVQFHVSPEVPVKRKNGFAKLATLCGFNLCEEKTQSKRNIKEELSFFNYTIKAKTWKFDEFWYKYENDIPMLASKAREVCTSPASSVRPESSFSVANYIHRKERTFDINRRTYLCNDWSKSGISYLKHKSFVNALTLITASWPTSFEIIYAGSWITKDAEIRYTLIKWESLVGFLNTV
ncbi:uncharacterized protein LOC124811958 [Hydra vulgaris]|uniref:uncharacterized protein LOC124811958 n=2 Tax=Hydra vulgaris TaxID=6087 RepID=UPI0032E9BEFE